MALCWGWEQQTQEAPAWCEGVCVVGGEEVQGVAFPVAFTSLGSASPVSSEPRACCTLFLCDKHKQFEALYQQLGSQHFPTRRDPHWLGSGLPSLLLSSECGAQKGATLNLQCLCALPRTLPGVTHFLQPRPVSGEEDARRATMESQGHWTLGFSGTLKRNKKPRPPANRSPNM